MTVPAEYNDVALRISPASVYEIGNNIQAAVGNVIDALGSITSTLNGLQLGWVGSTATEAKQFTDQWTAAMTNLFGVGPASGNGSASMGVLQQVIAALMTVGGNYGVAETGIVSMFNSLAAGTTTDKNTSTSSSTGGPTATSVTDPSQSSVGEINWAYL